MVIYDEKDKEVNRHSFSKMPIGRIGLAHENTITQYDDFEAEGPKVKGLSVQPLRKLAVTWARIKKQLQLAASHRDIDRLDQLLRSVPRLKVVRPRPDHGNSRNGIGTDPWCLLHDIMFRCIVTVI